MLKINYLKINKREVFRETGRKGCFLFNFGNNHLFYFCGQNTGS